MLKIDHEELMEELYKTTLELLKSLATTSIVSISEAVIYELRENVKYLLENTENKGEK